MSLLSKLFGSSKPSAPAEPETETYDGFTIEASPGREGAGYRIGAVITKVVDGETKTHHLIRADTVGDLEEAKKISIMKSKMVIDQLGDGLFR